MLAGLEFLTLWLLVGAYFVLSWRRGGQTMGMRPWRLKVVAADGKPASVRALWLRYAVAWLTPVVGLLWALVDAEHRALLRHRQRHPAGAHAGRAGELESSSPASPSTGPR